MVLTPEQQNVAGTITSLQRSIPSFFAPHNNVLETITRLHLWLRSQEAELELQLRRGSFNPEDIAPRFRNNVTSALEEAFQSLKKESTRSPEVVLEKTAGLKPLLGVELQKQLTTTCDGLEQAVQHPFLAVKSRLDEAGQMSTFFVSKLKDRGLDNRVVMTTFQELQQMVKKVLNLLTEAINIANSDASKQVRQLGEAYCNSVESQQ